MPAPSCDDDNFTHVAGVNVTQKCGDSDLWGRRWGQCDQWRSSCDKYWAEFLNTADYMAEAVYHAAWFPIGHPKHVDPCTFRGMYVDAMAYINRMVGSIDPINGVGYPGQDDPEGFVPRKFSLIFGGARFNSTYPNYDDTHQGAEDPYYANEEWARFPLEVRQQISNSEFCRSVMDKTYPCSGTSVGFPDACGGKCLKKGFLGIGCANYHCTHHPLEYWDLSFHNARMKLVQAVEAYESKNQPTLLGRTLDQYCAQRYSALVAAAPTVDVFVGTEEEFAHLVTYESDKIALEAEAANANLVDELLQAELAGGGSPAPSSLVPIAIAGAAIVGGVLLFNRIRRR